MCFVKPPKIPDTKVAPPPASAEGGAAAAQGAPETATKPKGNKRNQLRIDLKYDRDRLSEKPKDRDTSSNRQFLGSLRV